METGTTGVNPHQLGFNNRLINFCALVMVFTSLSRENMITANQMPYIERLLNGLKGFLSFIMVSLVKALKLTF